MIAFDRAITRIVSTEALVHARDKINADVGEHLPRARAEVSTTSAFDKAPIQQSARDDRRVRMRGGLLLDPDHPNEIEMLTTSIVAFQLNARPH